MVAHGDRARIDIPPASDMRCDLPEAFGRRFVIFGDAEEEFDWRVPFSRNATSTRAIAALPQATRHFNAAGAIPVYLLDYPVVDNRESGETIRAMVEDGACGIGTQLHPWVNPPHEEEVNTRNSFTANLPRTLQRAKLHALTERITEVTGQRPRIYRAGRYGIGKHSADLLVEAGYRMDVSVRALFDYRAQGGPDFSRHPVTPWRTENGLIECPLTAAYIGPLRHMPGLTQSRHLRGALSRLGLISRIALTPEDMPIRETLEALKLLLNNGHRLFSLSFHTPTVEPGHTPYVRDAADLAAFWTWWDAVFDFFARNSVSPIRGDEIIDALGSC